MPSPQLLVTKAEAARALGVSVRRIDQLRAEGRLFARKLGSKVVFPVRELEAFVDSLPGEMDQ